MSTSVKLITVPKFFAEIAIDLLWKLSNEIDMDEPAWDEVYEIKHDLIKRVCESNGNTVEVVDCDTPELDKLSQKKGFKDFNHLMEEKAKIFGHPRR